MNKKVLLIMFIAFISLFLVGCGKNNKTQILDCNISEGTTKLNMKLEYEDGNLIKGTMEYNYDYSKEEERVVNSYKAEDHCMSFKDNIYDEDSIFNAFGNCSQSWDDKKLTIIVNLETDKLLSISSFDKVDSIKKAKTQLEDVGYTCEIKK